MKAISLRWRLTLVTVLVLTAICVANTAYSVVNAKQMMSPLSDDLETFYITVQTVSDIAGTLVTDLPEEYQVPLREDTGIADHDFIVSDNIGYEVLEGGKTSQPVEDAAVTQEGGADLFYDTSVAIATIEAEGVVMAGQLESTMVTMTTARRSFNYSSLIFMVCMVLLGGVLVYFAAGYALKPVNSLSRDIEVIGGEQLSHRVAPGTGAMEINRLADSFNEMLERLEKSFSAQKRFSTAAAHELKTPLAVIRANIDVLEMERDPAKDDYAETFEIVKRQTERMSRLVDDLFSMSSLQECDLEERFQMDGIANAVVQELRSAAREKEIIIKVAAEKGLVKGNQVMLSRAVSNLVENAIRYNVHGGEIQVRCERRETDMRLQVLDTGPGIAEEHLASIFAPFYREDPSRSRKLGGAGLGLAIAAEIVDLHGGTISADNRPEGGAVFTITLPRIREEGVV